MKKAINRMTPKPVPDAFFVRVMRHADWRHKQAVLRLYRASKNVGKRCNTGGGTVDRIATDMSASAELPRYAFPKDFPQPRFAAS